MRIMDTAMTEVEDLAALVTLLQMEADYLSGAPLPGKRPAIPS